MMKVLAAVGVSLVLTACVTRAPVEPNTLHMLVKDGKFEGVAGPNWVRGNQLKEDALDGMCGGGGQAVDVTVVPGPDGSAEFTGRCV